MGRIKVKYIELRDLAFFLLTVDKVTLENLARELGLPNSGSPYHNWNHVTVRDVLKALEKRLVFNKDKKKEIETLLKGLGYSK